MNTLKNVGEYHLKMEQQLGLLRETEEAFLRAECKSWEEFQAEKHGFEWTFKQLFPRCLRYSFVVFLYSVIETELISFCREFSKRRNLPDLNLQGKKFSFERCKPFLSKTVGIEIGNVSAWNRLTFLEKVRNCIAHTGGIVEDSKDKKLLKEAAGAGIGITISEGRLDIESTYCKASTDAAIEFFRTAFDRGGFGPETARVLR